MLALGLFLPKGHTQTDPLLLSQPNSLLGALANPALVPRMEGIVVQLPAFASQTWFEGPTWGDFVARQGGQRVLTMDDAIARMNDHNRIFQQNDLVLLGVALVKGRTSAGIASRFRLHAMGIYPKTLPQLIWQGNAQFVGQLVELDHTLDMYSFHELSAWGAIGLGKLTVGARLKWLNGVQALRTERNALALHTDEEDYAITIHSDYLLYSAGTFDYRSLQDFTIDLPGATLADLELFTRNAGFGLDLGVAWRSDTWEVGASVTDLGGRIRWTRDPRAWRSQGDFGYSGVDISAALTGDSVTFGDAIDTLRSLLHIEQTDATFETALPTRYWLSAQHRINALLRAGAVLSAVTLDEDTYATLSLQGSVTLGSFVEGGAALNLRKGPQPTTLALSASAKLGPVRASAWVDNPTAIAAPA
ncbi:MAG: hypothetical protein D6818_00330, partial [Bacteroidetes bacterium]